MQEIVHERGGEVLSKTFRNVRTKMRFKCEDGHTWWAFPYNIRAGYWCPECGNKKKGATLKHSMEFIHELAEEKGIKCLSTEYVNGLSKLKWECSKGHKFKESYHTVSRRANACKRCPRLIHKTTLTLEKMQKIAEKHDGEVLSEKYVSGGKKMHFKCKKGHSFWKQTSEITKGSWCAKCSYEKMAKKNKYPMKFILEFAKSKGGKCLSTAQDYKNSFSNLKWECGNGHKFRGCYHITKRRKNFCKKCAGV